MMRDEIGRNDPCWCGSGRKFKRCHLNRVHEEPPSHEEIIAEIRKAQYSQACLHPAASPSVCSGRAIQSHSLPLSSLRAIAEDGHVVSLCGGYDVFLKTDGDVIPKRIGIRTASTFPAFCEAHDSKTFAVIEALPYEPSPEHAFLSSYRALCRELFHNRVRQRLNESLAFSMDRGMVLEGQHLVQSIAAAQREQDALAQKSLDALKAAYDTALGEGDFSQMQFYAIHFERCPDVMTSSMFAPFVDFNGCRVREADVLGTTDHHCIVSLFASGAAGWLQIAWLGQSVAGERFVASFAQLPDDQVANAAVRLVFSHFENTYFRQSWWAGLPESTQAYLLRRFWRPDNPFLPRSDNYLVDDGVRLARWQVVGRYFNVSTRQVEER